MRRLLLLPLVLLLGCGDLSSSTGELGRIDYTLHSDFLVDGSALVGTPILTGHPQRIDLDLTDAGERASDSTLELVHSATPSAGVSIEGSATSGDPGSISITVITPGEYVVESVLDGEVFDRITLLFDAPASLDVLPWIRPPNADDFTEASGSPIAVAEGAQAAFVPIPINAGGDRIAGDFVPGLTADPEWAVVRGVNVLGIYEQNVVVARSPSSVYFIEPGAVAITLSDDANGVSADVFFEVAPVVVP